VIYKDNRQMRCECNPHCSQTKIQKGQFLLPFFFIYTKIISDEGVMKE
jgi:hypothetical protein